MAGDLLFPQIMVILCFIGIIVILFFEKKDYLVFAVMFMLIAALFSALFIEEARHMNTYIDAVEWEVIFFFIPMFIIIAILEPVFEEIAIRLLRVESGKRIRLLFMLICVITTLAASFILALPTILIFVPIVINLCRKIHVNPAPFLIGISVCVNIAATLTPFGSAQNVLIYNHFGLSTVWFFTYLSPYFFITLIITIFFLDRFILRRDIQKDWVNSCSDDKSYNEALDLEEQELKTRMDPKHFKMNLVALVIFFVLLFLIQEIYVVALIGCVIFIFLNPVAQKDGSKRADLTYYASKVNYKIIYFFICLFILTHLMELNGTIAVLEKFIENMANQNIFWLSVQILLITSMFSGLLDNEPVTIMFLPILDTIIFAFAGSPVQTPLLIAFILGINLGGNFLPQGSSADLMNLELAHINCIDDMNYKRLTKVGASFALLHILIGIVYLYVIINFFLPAF